MSHAEAKIVSDGNITNLSEMKEKAAPTPAKKGVVSNVSNYLFKYGRKQRYTTGHYIIREGHLDKTVFIILQGSVEILKNDDSGKKNVVASFDDGGLILGEMSIFLNEPRSSSVRTTSDVLALEFTGENFIKAVVNIPELSLRILKSLSSKLKNTNTQVVEIQHALDISERKNANYQKKIDDKKDKDVVNDKADVDTEADMSENQSEKQK